MRGRGDGEQKREMCREREKYAGEDEMVRGR